ncbi:Gfo/Idh/MocA family oxidoreductase [Xinfangfangia sp. D13-10-4-6]|uniref:Gfo/Idh/MocA family protein n=1 Tax=Pseudogemmobacter hezensis TaxID=2737662 RepID=UPI001553FD58|nr:Gfo/Idh/MocA family oxidoreductase [Pseudogemmobacter hezensis]NPD14968.1 Gfo/Idh/MocA family oxidoreductase [Pseudogemmobacter hezensis]
MLEKDEAMKPLGIGLIGCGMVTQHLHIPALGQLGDRFAVRALYDASPSVRGQLAARMPGAMAHDSIGALLDNPEVDAVLVASPSALHAPHAIAAMRAARHVLIEKPMCMTLPEADALAAAAQETGMIAQIGYMRRHAQAFHEAKRLIAAGGAEINMARLRAIIGPNSAFLKPTAAIIEGDDIPPESLAEAAEANALATRAVAGTTEGPRAFVHMLLLGLSTHDISVMRGLIGMPARVLSARHRRDGRFLTVDFDYGDFICHFETGIDRIARFDASMEVLSDERVIRLDYDTPFVRHLPATLRVTEAEGESGVKETFHQPMRQDAFVAEWASFHAAITEGAAIDTDIADARQDLLLIENIMAVLAS